MNLRDMATTDPACLYSAFVGSRTHLWDCPIHVPNIRDGHGKLIKPNEYEEKLKHLTPVTIDVVLKL